MECLMKRIIPILALVTGLLAALPSAWSYEEIVVSNGGTVTGQVFLKGTKPDPKAYNLALYPEPAFCGRISTGTGWRLLDQFPLAPDGGLQNAVVMLEGVEKGKSFEADPPQIEARDCTFAPSVVTVRDGDQVGLVNMDPIIHDVQVYEMSPSGSRVLFHRPLRLNPYHAGDDPENHAHPPGERLIDTVEFSKGRRIFLIECGFHEYMQTWGVRVDNPYYAITDATGSFTLTDVPSGVYKLVAWHPGMGGILWKEITILEGEIVHARFEFDPPRERRSANTTMVDNPHYDLQVLGLLRESVEIQPTHEVQQP